MSERLFDPEAVSPRSQRARVEFVAGVLSRFVCGEKKPTADERAAFMVVASDAMARAGAVRPR